MRRRRAEMGGVNRFVVGRSLVRGAGGFEDVAARAMAGIDEAGGVEFFEDGSVERASGLLVVGRVGAAEVGAFLPHEAEPAQVGEHGFDEIEAEAGRVEVVVAQDERAGGLPCALGGDPEGARVPEVQVTSRGGRETASVGGRGHVKEEALRVEG